MTRFSPLWLQQGSYAASVDRRLVGFGWSAAAVSGCAVTVASGMVVNVAPGQVAVPAANNTGAVLCSSDAVEAVTLAAAPGAGTNRYDLVVCQARGNDLDGGANNDFLFTNVTGTAAASPTVPAVPNNAVALAQIYVPGGSASVTAGNITDVRRMAATDNSKQPQGRLAFVQRTTDGPNVAAETVALTTPAITLPPNRLIRLVAYARNVIAGSGDPYVQLRLREGATTAGTQLQDFVANLTTSGAQVGSSAVGVIQYAYPTPPTPGTGKQWSLTVAASSTNAARITAVANTPAWLAVFDDGGI